MPSFSKSAMLGSSSSCFILVQWISTPCVSFPSWLKLPKDSIAWTLRSAYRKDVSGYPGFWMLLSCSMAQAGLEIGCQNYAIRSEIGASEELKRTTNKIEFCKAEIYDPASVWSIKMIGSVQYLLDVLAGFCFWKQSLQYTGFNPFGLKGTWHCFPHFAQVASCISLGARLKPPLLKLPLVLLP
jgi:hypothetical protein